MTHLQKLLDKMCKYEMDPTSIVEDTEQTWFCPQTDRRTRWNQYTPPFNFIEAGGIKSFVVIYYQKWLKINKMNVIIMDCKSLP